MEGSHLRTWLVGIAEKKITMHLKKKNKMQRDFALNELKVSLLGESMGPAFAVASDLIVERTELNLPKN